MTESHCAQADVFNSTVGCFLAKPGTFMGKNNPLKLESIRDIVPYFLNLYRIRLERTTSTLLSLCYAQWWHVSIGKSCCFYGIPLFYKHHTARIVMGRQCTLRSSERSNTIGLNRRCYLSAEGRNAEVRLGNRCGLSATVISAQESIILGDRVRCGGNCTIIDSDRHPLNVNDRNQGMRPVSAPIVIEDDVWLGMNVVVLKGCRIGKGTVVAANSVVTRSLPSGILAAGTPAKVIREIDQS